VVVSRIGPCLQGLSHLFRGVGHGDKNH
jgi:hypothetical protein